MMINRRLSRPALQAIEADNASMHIVCGCLGLRSQPVITLWMLEPTHAGLMFDLKHACSARCFSMRTLSKQINKITLQTVNKLELQRLAGCRSAMHLDGDELG